MARALLGHLASSADLHLITENARLRRRVADLEAQVAELREHTFVHQDVELHAELHAMTMEHQPETV